MPRLNDTIPYSLQNLLRRYSCSRDVLSGWLATAVENDEKGRPVTLINLLEQAGYRKKQSYFTLRQWRIITDHLDPILKKDELES
ncbi:hypothetical protein [Spirosoma aerolatum]|uniref:hypothetical protein n=1 Tax=Spirosoma aerolatum TaxID=1211326 RepID=UPI0009AEC253|nr:hypothetical protein [Spirosoma aerolatum]